MKRGWKASVAFGMGFLVLTACKKEKNENKSVSDGQAALPAGGVAADGGKGKADLNMEAIQKQIQEQTEKSIAMANQQRIMQQQQLQMQMAQQQALQNNLNVQRQVQQATNAANQSRGSQKK